MPAENSEGVILTPNSIKVRFGAQGEIFLGLDTSHLTFVPVPFLVRFALQPLAYPTFPLVAQLMCSVAAAPGFLPDSRASVFRLSLLTEDQWLSGNFLR